MKLAFTLILDFDIDGERPKTLALIDYLESQILQSLPGVFIRAEDDYVIPVNSVSIKGRLG